MATLRPVLQYALAVALGISASAVSLGAQPLPTDRVYVEFTNGARLPGVVLEPGQYLLVLGMPVGGQTIIDIYRAKDSRLIASCLAVETRRARPSHTTMTEYAGTAPPAIRAWFHPGNAIGFEFVYPAAEAKMLYLASGEAVPFGSVGNLKRDMVGTFAVAVSAAPVEGAPRPVGTSGVLPPPARVFGAAEHLEASRRTLAEALASASEQVRPRLVLLIELFERLETAYQAGRARDVQKHLTVTTNTLSSILPSKPSRFSGTPPLDEETQAALERVRAHLTAFATFIR